MMGFQKSVLSLNLLVSEKNQRKRQTQTNKTNEINYKIPQFRRCDGNVYFIGCLQRRKR